MFTIDQDKKEEIEKDGQLYYCSANGHLWRMKNGEKLFYAWLDDATVDEVESAIERYCGCND